jgi:hypothetical protein
MSLILQKTRFKGECRVQLEHFWPFLNDKDFHPSELVLFLNHLREHKRDMLQVRKVTWILMT